MPGGGKRRMDNNSRWFWKQGIMGFFLSIPVQLHYLRIWLSLLQQCWFSGSNITSLDVDISKTKFRFFSSKYDHLFKAIRQLKVQANVVGNILPNNDSFQEWSDDLQDIIEGVETYEDFIKQYGVAISFWNATHFVFFK